MNYFLTKFKNKLKTNYFYIKYKYKNINFEETNKFIDFPASAKNISIIKDSNYKCIKSAAIFACFSNTCLIQDYHLYYLNELSKCVDIVILIFDNPIITNELKKLKKNNIIFMQFKRHNMYDFGSYKVGISFLKEKNLLNKLDFLILCNDSCFGPLFNLNNLIKKMNMKKNDFWGLVYDTEFAEHLQSWFICLKHKALNHKNLFIFFRKIKKQKNSWHVIIKYEIAFTRFLAKKGLRFDYFISKQRILEKNKYLNIKYNNLMFYPNLLVRNFNFPFIKIKSFNEYPQINNESKKVLLFCLKKNRQLYNCIKKYIKNANLK